MNTNFDLKKFLTENKLTPNSRLSEVQEKSKIRVLKDLYYFEELDGLSAKDKVDEKHHGKSKLIFKKNTTVEDDSNYSDSEYEMIINSSRLKEGEDYKILDK